MFLSLLKASQLPLKVTSIFMLSANRENSTAAPAKKRNEGKIVAVIGAVVDVQVRK